MDDVIWPLDQSSVVQRFSPISQREKLKHRDHSLPEVTAGTVQSLRRLKAK
jgi:hypothetical protein